MVKRPERGDHSAQNATQLEPIGREALFSLSQRKLNALGIPVAYIDRRQRYRFANKTFLEWTGKRLDEVVGHDVAEVIGRDIFQLYHAYMLGGTAG